MDRWIGRETNELTDIQGQIDRRRQRESGQ